MANKSKRDINSAISAEALAVISLAREEIKLSREMVSIFPNKLADLAKLLLGVTTPLLVAAYSIDIPHTNVSQLRGSLWLIIFISLVAFAISIWMEAKLFEKYSANSSSRLKLITALQTLLLDKLS